MSNTIELKYKNIIDNLESKLPQGKKIKYSTANIMRVLFLAKYTKTVKAIELLDKNGFYEDANILIRTLFEILITVLYCEISPNEYYERYEDYCCIPKIKFYNSIKKYGYAIDENRLKELEQEGKNFLTKYNVKKANKWNNLTFFATLDKVIKYYNCDDYMKIYDCIYCLSSEYIHTSSQSLQKSYFKFVDNKCYYNSDPIIEKDKKELLTYVEIISEKILNIYNEKNYV